MIRKNRFLVPKGYRAITLYPFIFVRNDSDKLDKELINHERIHLRQKGTNGDPFLYLVFP